MGETEREQGRKEGRIDAQLEEHSKHLAKVNGNIERFAEQVERLVASIAGLASEIRTLQEEGRLAEERVRVAADTLATETERRREELATSVESTDRSFSKRERIAALAVTVVVALIGFFLATH